MTHATHPNAVLTPAGRLKMAQLVVKNGWTEALAAERFSVGITTVRRWAGRYRDAIEQGLSPLAAMQDRSSRPAHCPHQLPRRVERRILGLRVARRWGPARIAYRLGLNPSTVHKVLQRYGCPRLKWTDPATGTRTKWARAKVHHYVHAAPGDLVHVDIKKLGRIPDGGGWRFKGRQAGRKNSGQRGTGYAYIHHAVDDHSRLAYSEIHSNERKETAVAFWRRARRFFAAHGITVKRVLTDIQSRWATIRTFVSTGGKDRGRPAPARHRYLTEWSTNATPGLLTALAGGAYCRSSICPVRNPATSPTWW